MTSRVFPLVFWLAIFLPFEDFILKWLPVSDDLYSASRWVSELVIYGLGAYVVAARLVRGLPLRRTPMDLAFAAFLATSALSVFFTDSDVLVGIINLRTLLRYVVVFYIVANLDVSEAQTWRLVRAIMLVAVIQGAIGLLQAAQGGPGEFWLPRATSLEVAGYKKDFTVLGRGLEKGAVIGGFGHSVAMGLYLVIALIMAGALWLHEGFRGSRGRLIALTLGFGGLALFFTYSRASILACCFGAVALVFWLQTLPRARGLMRAGGVVLALLLIVMPLRSVGGGTRFVKVKQEYVNPIENFEMLFSSEYFEGTKGSRPWLLFTVGSEVLRQFPLIGFGPDEAAARRKIVDGSSSPIHRILSFRAFEDVYWMAMLAYYGMIGVGCYLLMLHGVYRSGRDLMRMRPRTLDASVGAVVASLVVVAVPMTLIVRTFEYRTFGFYFWLLAGLAATRRARSADLRDPSETSYPA